MLYEEVLEALRPEAGGRYIDATVGAGGHAEGILERSAPDGRLLGLDADPEAVRVAAERLRRFGGRAVLVQRNFAAIAAAAEENGFEAVVGILFDLGVSSMLLEQGERGFSFQREAPLDMRFDPAQPTTAADLVNKLSLDELTRLLREYGEEPRARAVARAIVAARAEQPITTTRRLAEIVAHTAQWSERIHPATRTFQALRIATNEELENLEKALPQAVSLLRPGGRVAVISFHSLEDRIVKRFFNDEQRGCVCPPRLPVCVCGRRPRLRVLTKKPISPAMEEVRRNPRSRSAKLRVAERLA